MTTLLAVRFIDLAIFGSLGTLWIAGATFIFLLYRWIIRFEADGRSAGGAPRERAVEAVREPKPERPSPLPAPAAARSFVPQPHVG